MIQIPLHKSWYWVLVIMSSWVVCGCVASQPTLSDPILLEQIDAFAATITARANNQGETDRTVQTARAEATEYQLTLIATQTLQGKLDDANINATATAQAPVLAELPIYGVDPAHGSVAWLHLPVTLEVDEFRSGDFANDYAMTSAADFVLASDITWDTEYGTSGCGFAVRSDGETEAANQYLVMLSRNANGHVYFTALAEGKPANYRDFYANRADPVFQWENGSLNRLSLVGKGTTLWVYTNHTLVGEIDITAPPPPAPDLPDLPIKPERPSADLPANMKKRALDAYQKEMEKYQQALESYNQMVDKIQSTHAAVMKSYYGKDTIYTEGFVGLVAFSYSGYVRCEFGNTWLWIIE